MDKQWHSSRVHASYRLTLQPCKSRQNTEGFWMDELLKENYQPSPKWLSDLHTGNPGQPWVWTEDQGWYDQWGVAKRVRDSRDQLYGIARFYARGGAYHNFYMLTGGNNYGKLSSNGVTTAYVRCAFSTEIHTRGCHWFPRLLA
jgi:hypothetical protein